MLYCFMYELIKVYKMDIHIHVYSGTPLLRPPMVKAKLVLILVWSYF